MGIINKMRKQNAIYWPPSVPDDHGRRGFGALVELTLTGGVNSRVRWEDVTEEYLDAEGTVQRSKAVVYVPVLPLGGEVALGGFLWLGDRADLTDQEDPTQNAGAHEIKRFDRLPNLKATETLRTVYL